MLIFNSITWSVFVIYKLYCFVLNYFEESLFNISKEKKIIVYVYVNAQLK